MLINILTGAQLQGDIVSEWDPRNGKLHRSAPAADALQTTLTFGRAALSDGTAGTADPGFNMLYTGNIQGAQSLKMSLEAGRLSLTGSVDVLSLENSGTLALYQADTGTEQVTVADSFTNAADATLETGFDAQGQTAGITANKAELAGTWAARPMPDFYASKSVIELEAPVTATTSSGTMAVALATNASPTLHFALQNTSYDSASVSVDRAANVYSQYAANDGSASVGRALGRIANEATGDMQNLFAALDWSGKDGSGVTRGLKQLGPEAYDAAARASLAQQSEFNLLLVRRMLGTASRRAAEPVQSGPALTAVASPMVEPDAPTWQVWAMPYGAGAYQQSHNGLSSWKSTGVGLLVGADRHFDSGLDVGGHVAVAARRTHVQDGASARVDSKSAFVGAQAYFEPQGLDGLWFSGLGRLGIESGDMDREVTINGYHRTMESHWSGLAGSVQAGLGKDFRLFLDNGHLSAGPLGLIEYAFVRRPSLDEDDGGAAALDVDGGLYESLILSLGAHAGWQTTLANGSTLGLDVLAAWRHELLDATFATTAAFRGYQAYGFESETELPGRDSVLVQAGLSLARADNFAATLEVGGEFGRTGYTAGNVGLNLSWQF